MIFHGHAPASAHAHTREVTALASLGLVLGATAPNPAPTSSATPRRAGNATMIIPSLRSGFFPASLGSLPRCASVYQTPPSLRSGLFLGLLPQTPPQRPRQHHGEQGTPRHITPPLFQFVFSHARNGSGTKENKPKGGREEKAAFQKMQLLNLTSLTPTTTPVGGNPPVSPPP